MYIFNIYLIINLRFKYKQFTILLFSIFLLWLLTQCNKRPVSSNCPLPASLVPPRAIVGEQIVIQFYELHSNLLSLMPMSLRCSRLPRPRPAMSSDVLRVRWPRPSDVERCPPSSVSSHALRSQSLTKVSSGSCWPRWGVMIIFISHMVHTIFGCI